VCSENVPPLCRGISLLQNIFQTGFVFRPSSCNGDWVDRGRTQGKYRPIIILVSMRESISHGNLPWNGKSRIRLTVEVLLIQSISMHAEKRDLNTYHRKFQVIVQYLKVTGYCWCKVTS